MSTELSAPELANEYKEALVWPMSATTKELETEAQSNGSGPSAAISAQLLKDYTPLKKCIQELVEALSADDPMRIDSAALRAKDAYCNIGLVDFYLAHLRIKSSEPEPRPSPVPNTKSVKLEEMHSPGPPSVPQQFAPPSE